MIRTSNNKVALYARFSSDNQRTESIDAQIRAMNVYCEQNGYTIVKTYIDEARSATTDRRPSFQQMIKDSGNREFDILLVHKLDRFARNRYDSAVYKRELKKNGVSVYSVLENLDNSPESIMLEAVIEGMSEYYSQNLARETMKGMIETALQCKHTGGKPPLGYDVDVTTRRLVINHTESETVKMIFDMFVEGYSYGDIIAELNLRGMCTKQGSEFHKNSLHDILSNEKYKGTYIFNRSSHKNPNGTRNSHRKKEQEEIIAIPGGCPAIISEETFDKAQKKLAENKRLGGTNKAKENYLLSSKVFCKECGRPMHGNTHNCGRGKTRLSTYRCPNRCKDCNNKEINRDYLEDYVISLIETEILNTRALKRITGAIEEKSVMFVSEFTHDAEQLDNSLADVELQIKNVADAIADGLISEALVARLHELENEKNRLQSRKSHITGDSLKHEITIDSKYILGEYSRLKKTPTHPAYKAFIQSFVDSIYVGRYTVYITLKTGLDVFSELNKTYEARRQVIYERICDKNRRNSCSENKSIGRERR